MVAWKGNSVDPWEQQVLHNAENQSKKKKSRNHISLGRKRKSPTMIIFTV
jgi:hypothetical protein